MRVSGRAQRTIWREGSDGDVGIIDQTLLPHAFETLRLTTVVQAAHAIRSMQVRGAPLIGVMAAYGMALAMRERSDDRALQLSAQLLKAARPTAVNLAWAVDRAVRALASLADHLRRDAAYALADAMAEEDVAACRALGEHGARLIAEQHARHPDRAVNVLTHCNAGWLATVDWGTALAPVFLAFERGIPLHVWADETRPRSQGYLTAWELQQAGVSHTLVVDNAGGHLMQHGHVDLCIVGTDRTTARGDVCNKIGTYLKALAAKDNGVPFYAAVPTSSIDWTLDDGVAEIPIEERDEREVHEMRGWTADGRLETVRVTPVGVRSVNHGFDVTPARLMSGLITERGVCAASRDGLAGLFPELACAT